MERAAALNASPRRVIVTAGGAGIGLAITEGFVENGDRVAAIDADLHSLESLSAGHRSVSIHHADIANAEAARRAVAAAAAALGGIDVLVNNAGIAGPTAALEEIGLEDWQRVLDVNVTGTMLVTQAALPHLKASPSGVIVMMSSIGGRLGYPERSPYSASKWALIGLTKSWAMELGEYGVRVNAVLPGPVAGERLDRVIRDRAVTRGVAEEVVVAELLRNQSIKRFTTPTEVAEIVRFVASPAARSMSGATIQVDGDMQAAR